MPWRRLGRVEQGWATPPHNRLRDLALLVGRDDLMKLLQPLQAEDDHAGAIQLRPLLRGAVARWLAQSEVEREQRGDRVVLKLLCLLADSIGNRRRVEQLKECLLWI